MQSSEGVGGQRHVALIVQCPTLCGMMRLLPICDPSCCTEGNPARMVYIPMEEFIFSLFALPASSVTPLRCISLLEAYNLITTDVDVYFATAHLRSLTDPKAGGPAKPVISSLPRSAGSLPIVGLTVSRVVRGWSAWISTMSILLLRTCREVSASLRKGTPWTVCDNNSSTIATSRPSLPSVRLRAMG